MKSEKALRTLHLAICTPMVLGILFLGLDFLGQTADSLPNFNRLFAIMTPLQTTGGMLLVIGIEIYVCFVAYKNSLYTKQ